MTTNTTDELWVGDAKYPTPEAATRAREAVISANQAAEARRDTAVAEFERELKSRFMAVPGSTEDAWKQQRAAILAKARESNRARYGG